MCDMDASNIIQRHSKIIKQPEDKELKTEVKKIKKSSIIHCSMLSEYIQIESD
jgi:hypothetical protein